MENNKDEFTFEISLSVLDHLGRNLYRSFATVLGEAISNAWDADADNVWIYIDREKNTFLIKDDGTGMSAGDYQKKFLKIGYSKRKERKESEKGRPYIGRKGIGKLALLSCADKIIAISKKKGAEYVGGVIDNSGLNDAITADLTPQEYRLGKWELASFDGKADGLEQGTVIRFEGIKEGIKNSLDFLKKIIALYFRFSLIDSSFKIFLGDEQITHHHLKDLAEKTQFLWKINDIDDPYVKGLEQAFSGKDKKKVKQLTAEGAIKGFIASVEKPRDLKILTIEERVGVDLFVNGRLRERDILKHIPTARIPENYFYGQIHFDGLDDELDRFTSSRESIVANDPKYKGLLDKLKNDIIPGILEDWDKWRRKLRQDGDPDNPSLSKKERKAQELFNAVSEEYSLPTGAADRKKVEGWVDGLGNDAMFNFTSYAECFISENLIRKYINEQKVNLSPVAAAEVATRKKNEAQFKGKGGLSIDIRKDEVDLGYLSMDHLANLVDKRDPLKEACLSRDANEYKPIRDALMHTSLLTDVAKKKLTSVYENIKGRIKTLLVGGA